MPQLAGSPCGVCRQPLLGARDGAFCPVCESPIHLGCAKSATSSTLPTVCPRCGTLKTVAKQRREYELACEHERLTEEFDHNPDAVAPPIDWSLSNLLLRFATLLLIFGTAGTSLYFEIPRTIALAFIVVPVVACRRLLFGSPKTPAHLDPTQHVSTTKGDWRNQIDPPK